MFWYKCVLFRLFSFCKPRVVTKPCGPVKINMAALVKCKQTSVLMVEVTSECVGVLSLVVWLHFASRSVVSWSLLSGCIIIQQALESCAANKCDSDTDIYIYYMHRCGPIRYVLYSSLYSLNQWEWRYSESDRQTSPFTFIQQFSIKFYK